MEVVMKSAAVLLTLVSVAAAQTAAPARAELETVYNKVRAAVKAKDYDAFLALVEPAKDRPAPPKAVFADAAPMILDGFPDLATTKFVKIGVSGDWAGYYALTDLDDKNFVTVAVFRFHRVAAGWKLSGAVASSSLPKAATAAEDQKAVAKEIETNESFRLPAAKP
jgi:hypothetical protein